MICKSPVPMAPILVISLVSWLANLLVLDDFGLQPISPQAAQDLYEIITERYERASLIIIPIAPLKSGAKSLPMISWPVQPSIASPTMPIPSSSAATAFANVAADRSPVLYPEERKLQRLNQFLNYDQTRILTPSHSFWWYTSRRFWVVYIRRILTLAKPQ